MKSCPSCGNSFKDTESYCPKCGFKLKSPLPISLYINIIATFLVIFGVNIIINILAIIISISAIAYAIIKENYNKWSIGLSIYCIIASGIWIMFNFIN